MIASKELHRDQPIILGEDYCAPSANIRTEVSHQLGPDNETPIALRLHYVLPDGAGSVWHIKPYDLEPFEAIFAAYQEADPSKSSKKLATSLFKRAPMRQVSRS